MHGSSEAGKDGSGSTANSWNFYLRILTRYQVVAYSPRCIAKPSATSRAVIGLPIVLPAPFRGTASTRSAGLRFRRVTFPVTGSMTVGAEPQLERDVLSSFQVIASFAERAVAASSRLRQRAMGSPSRDVMMIEQNSFSTVAEMFFSCLLLSLTKPTRACDFSVSTVTSPFALWE